MCDGRHLRKECHSHVGCKEYDGARMSPPCIRKRRRVESYKCEDYIRCSYRVGRREEPRNTCAYICKKYCFCCNISTLAEYIQGEAVDRQVKDVCMKEMMCKGYPPFAVVQPVRTSEQEHNRDEESGCNYAVISTSSHTSSSS